MVKMVKGIVPFGNNIMTYDCGFKIRGPRGDSEYIKNDWYRTHLRRGNTFVRLPNGKIILARKCNQKFFDLVYEHI